MSLAVQGLTVNTDIINHDKTIANQFTTLQFWKVFCLGLLAPANCEDYNLIILFLSVFFLGEISFCRILFCLGKHVPQLLFGEVLLFLSIAVSLLSMPI